MRQIDKQPHGCFNAIPAFAPSRIHTRNHLHVLVFIILLFLYSFLYSLSHFIAVNNLRKAQTGNRALDVLANT